LQPNQIHGRLTEVAEAEKCSTTPDGLAAILRLAAGDMRRVLNLLQATAMSSTVVDETSVYLTSGSPLPTDVDFILDLLMNQTFRSACEEIINICMGKGYALADVLSGLTEKLMCLEMDSVPLAMLLDGMSAVEHRLAFGTDEKLQIASLVGVFIKTRHTIQIAA
jgi:replication factor C subunit 3/5